jgi:hypothetical protein
MTIAVMSLDDDVVMPVVPRWEPLSDIVITRLGTSTIPAVRVISPEPEMIVGSSSVRRVE